jgi:hypothetical protein
MHTHEGDRKKEINKKYSSSPEKKRKISRYDTAH